MYLPDGLKTGTPELSCGQIILVMSGLLNRRSYTAATTSDETKEQSWMMVCVMDDGDTARIICGLGPKIVDARAHFPKSCCCSVDMASRPSGSSHGVLKEKLSLESSLSHGRKTLPPMRDERARVAVSLAVSGGGAAHDGPGDAIKVAGRGAGGVTEAVGRVAATRGAT